MLARLKGSIRPPARALAVAAIAGLLTAGIAAADEAAAGKYAGIVVDAKTGKTLYQADPDGLRFPASLTKMMTLYLVFEELDRGELKLDSRFTVSSFAASQPPSKLGVRPGDTITVRESILALVTESANDVAVVIAENIGGSESAFAARMTATARGIGMSRTTFRNASGLPNSGQVTTARDMATLGRALRDRFPQYYSFFSTRSFAWRGRVIGNHNRLLGRVEGVDGIKTGYTRASGFNLVTSVQNDKRYVVAVVLGGRTGRSRDTQMAQLLENNMTRASTGPRTAPLLLAGAVGRPARTEGTVTKVAAVETPAPRKKPEDEVTTTASIATIAAAAAATKVTAVATKSVAVADNRTAEGDTDEDEKSEKAAAGWKIQIGALPSESQAQEMIGKAKAALPTVLASAVPFTETVNKGSAMLYRARFGGFASKESARAACDKLAKKDFACLAIQ